MIDDEPWFVAVHVCFMLGYSSGRQSVAYYTEPHQRNTVSLRDGNRGNPNRLCVSEGGLYALIMGSRLPAAVRFKTWVTDVVLPAIRKDDAYVLGEERVAAGEMSPDDLILKGYEAVMPWASHGNADETLKDRTSLNEHMNTALAHSLADAERTTDQKD